MGYSLTKQLPTEEQWNSLPIELRSKILLYANIYPPSKRYALTIEDERQRLARKHVFTQKEFNWLWSECYFKYNSSNIISIGCYHYKDTFYTLVEDVDTNVKKSSLHNCIHPSRCELFPSVCAIKNVLYRRGVEYTVQDIMYHIIHFRNTDIYILYICHILNSICKLPDKEISKRDVPELELLIYEAICIHSSCYQIS